MKTSNEYSARAELAYGAAKKQAHSLRADLLKQIIDAVELVKLLDNLDNERLPGMLEKHFAGSSTTRADVGVFGDLLDDVRRFHELASAVEEVEIAAEMRS